MRVMIKIALPLLMLVILSPVQASSVRIISMEDEIVYAQGETLPLSVTLQIENTIQGETPNILIWQIGLNIVPVATATGTIGFVNADEPDEYLFSGLSSPMSIPSLPLPVPPTVLTVSDVVVPGVSLPENTPRNIIALDFSVSDNASGVFYLSLSPFTGSSVDSSAWSSELISDPMDAQEFENAGASSSFESRIVATIRIISVPEPSSLVVFGIGLVGLIFYCGRNSSNYSNNY